MYHLFYAGHMLFGGIGYALGAVGILNGIVKREERHQIQLIDIHTTGFWEGYSQAWPKAYSKGEENMLEVCQALATESIDMVGVDVDTQRMFAEIVATWPEFALQQEDPSHQSNPLPTYASDMFSK
jgi:hypothetical protein